MVNKDSIQLAIADLKSQKVKNYTVTARKYGINMTTLRQHYIGTQLSQNEAASHHKKKISNLQEEQLLLHIEKLTAHSFASTPQII
ncbi:hypothetical protein PAAG_01818 [Paracoccidioides lutzii Pb01]|uniref:Uncharacterized protein n=1 Tax=Paracoccidioides lutzii (strain ATCC MYA-826 / Pb01) TaxID=502779 RepID=C1GTH3_PARBA|nr:hypothetical protein PAAG_01818 [Paracoccidioides lutzii Pb01]EEH39629.1 hypothetical protein PAAG_01818 [Paracoccidioides lutzii Pb01]